MLISFTFIPGARAQTPTAPPAAQPAPTAPPAQPRSDSEPTQPAPAPAVAPAPVDSPVAPTSADPVAPPPPAAPAEIVAPAPAEKPKKSGFSIESDDGAHKLDFKALVHADARFFFPRRGPATTDTFLLRRVRPALDAKVFRYFELRVQPDFAGSRLQLLDAYGNIHFIDEAQLRVGKGKSPVGFERLQSPAEIMFIERGFPTLLAPNRDVGVELHGKLWKGALAYAAGIYNGVPDGGSGDQDQNGEKDYAGRVFVRPFLPTDADGPLSGIGVGIAATHGIQQGALATYRTSGQQTFFAPADVAQAAGDRTLVAPQAAYYFGPAGAVFEFTRVKQRVSDGAAGFTQLDVRAWQLAGSVVLGGSQSFQGVKVDDALDPAAGKWGAFELALRYQAIHFDPRVFRTDFASRSSSARVARSWTLGGTWHFAKRVRTLVNYERTTFEGGAASGGDRDPEDVLISRLQVAF